ncbi:hypothetical protein [Streptomyces sp. PsTaAH-124]|uniref:hypothetical protein n=1 Tax=Streptomyces sp. PsTaAH-124 TaxID=1157638 RepID=UPI000476E4B5|nr:hypothetical protein [Streptomyces sp. PsTaAH-124]
MVVDNPFTRERTYVATELAEQYGRGYARILARMSGLAFRGRGDNSRTSQRILRAKLEGFQKSAVIVLLSDDYNNVDKESEAEALVKEHRTKLLEAIEKDEKERQAYE